VLAKKYSDNNLLNIDTKGNRSLGLGLHVSRNSLLRIIGINLVKITLETLQGSKFHLIFLFKQKMVSLKYICNYFH
jgi:hypothetical protein